MLGVLFAVGTLHHELAVMVFPSANFSVMGTSFLATTLLRVTCT